MDTKVYLYEDPTGGGSDAELTLPICFTPPDQLHVRHKNGGSDWMELLGQKDEEDNE